MFSNRALLGLTSIYLVVPKEHTIFRFEVSRSPPTATDDMVDTGQNDGKHDEQNEERDVQQKLVFEMFGSQFANRAPERATKKVKLRVPSDL